MHRELILRSAIRKREREFTAMKTAHSALRDRHIKLTHENNKLKANNEDLLRRAEESETRTNVVENRMIDELVKATKGCYEACAVSEVESENALDKALDFVHERFPGEYQRWATWYIAK